MLRHIFIGPVFPDCTDERLSGVVDTLRTLPGIVPWIRKLSVENTLGWCESRAVLLDFKKGQSDETTDFTEQRQAKQPSSNQPPRLRHGAEAPLPCTDDVH